MYVPFSFPLFVSSKQGTGLFSMEFHAGHTKCSLRLSISLSKVKNNVWIPCFAAQKQLPAAK